MNMKKYSQFCKGKRNYLHDWEDKREIDAEIWAKFTIPRVGIEAATYNSVNVLRGTIKRGNDMISRWRIAIRAVGGSGAVYWFNCYTGEARVILRDARLSRGAHRVESVLRVAN